MQGAHRKGIAIHVWIDASAALAPLTFAWNQAVALRPSPGSEGAPLKARAVVVDKCREGRWRQACKPNWPQIDAPCTFG